MVNITFYKFTKEYNSTKRPTGGTSFQCQIKRGSGLMNPAIELNIGLENAPEYNYCYIPAFNRYYFISEWFYDTAFWTASLSCDVLATYRTEIGNTNLYALRSAANYDGRVVDHLYPTKAGCTYVSNAVTNMWTPTGGMYVMGVVNNIGLNDYQFGSLVYYVLTSQQASTLLSYLMSSDLFNTANGFVETDASWQLQKSITDPLQYIKSCVYIPVPAATITGTVTDLATPHVWDWDVYGQSSIGLVSILKKSTPSITFNRTFNIPKHPQTSARGNYVNQSPYSIITLMIPPFGLIEVDTTVTCNATTIEAKIEIDIPTGLGILTITCNGIVLNRIEAQIGIPIALSQVTRDYIGGVNSILSGIGSVAGGLMAGGPAGIFGAITGGVSAIGNAAQSLAPRSQTIGTGGGYAQIIEDPKIMAQFFELVDDDITKNGRPCCKVIQPKNNSGYLLIQDGDVEINGTREEAELIRTYLETGFYYE